MEKVAANSKFFCHSTEIIRQSKIKGPLHMNIETLKMGKTSKGSWEMKKRIVSDFDETQNLKFLWPKSFNHEN